MLRSVLLAAALLSACTASAPATTPAAALPSVPADPTAVAVAQPVAPTGDDALDAFLASFAAAIDRHDWRGVAGLSAAGPLDAAFQAALAAGDAPRDAAARAVAGVLGLDDVADGDSPFERLDAVRVITLRQVGAVNDLPGARYEVEGDVRLEGGETVPMAFYVSARGDGYAVGRAESSGTVR